MEIIKRWLNQRGVGYQKWETGLWLVVEGDIEFADGTIAKRWKLYTPIYSDLPERGELLEQCPAIDIPIP